ncbi:hypothetical protein ACMGDF_05465 [Morganella morganii]|uniref:hypothetical protein n=1 Tax=Morganella morganii TaxID=582 RepID=UPI003EBB6583
MSVESTIDFYLAEENPGYALQITGEWGAGKTHTIKTFLKDNMYYLSLFDMQSADEIYSSIFYLMQKKRSKAQNALNSLKNIEVSLLGIKIPAGELFSSLSSVIARTEVSNDKPIVFDDIERSGVPQEIIFGIISNYIENHGCRVIILMNDNKKEDDNEYKNLSEKTIGRVIKVIPKYSESYDCFISYSKNKEVLSLIKPQIISIFEKSNCNSLRILKRIIFEIDTICSCIEFEKNNNIISEIYEGLCVFTILSIAAKHGDINQKNIKERKSTLYYKLKKHNTNNKDENVINDLAVYEKVYEAHADNIEISTTILNDEVLNDIIFNGKYNRSLIIKSIDHYQYINKNNKEIPWKTIYKFMQYSDSNIRDAIDKTKDIIEGRIYYPLPHILQFISAIIFISDYINYDFGEKGMECYFCNYIDDLYEKDLLDPIDFSNITNSFTLNSCDGYGYFSSENDSFKVIKKYLIEKVNKLRNEKIYDESQRILLLMKNDTDALSKILIDNSSEFLYDPLLSNINLDNFINTLLDLDFSQLNKVTDIITKRAYRSFRHSKLDIERTWLNDVLVILKIKQCEFSGIKKLRMQNTIDRFESSVN